jgi:hypothetical protein
MQGFAVFGHLNKASTRFAVADYEANRVDIYKYSPSNLQFAYSFKPTLRAARSALLTAPDPSRSVI